MGWWSVLRKIRAKDEIKIQLKWIKRIILKIRKGLMQLFSQMPDSKSPYLTASSLLSQYGRKIIHDKNMHSHPPHTTPKNWIKANKNYYRSKKKWLFKRPIGISKREDKLFLCSFATIITCCFGYWHCWCTEQVTVLKRMIQWELEREQKNISI